MAGARSTKVVAVRMELAWAAVLEQAADKAGMTVPDLVKQAVKQRVVEVLGEGMEPARARELVQGRIARWHRDQQVNHVRA